MGILEAIGELIYSIGLIFSSNERGEESKVIKTIVKIFIFIFMVVMFTSLLLGIIYFILLRNA